MKHLVVTLALVFFTGSQAFTLRDEEYPHPTEYAEYLDLGEYEEYPHLAEWKQEIKEYLSNISRAVNEKIKYIDRLEIGQSIVHRLRESYAEVTKCVRNLEVDLPSEVSEAYHRVVAASMSTVEKGLGALHRLKRRVTPASQKLTQSFYFIVATYANSVLGKVGNYTEAMRRIVADKAEKLKTPELMEKLKQQLEELRNQLGPYTQKFKSQVEEFKASLEPFANRTHETFRQGVRRINQTLKGYLSSILATLQRYTKDFKDWVDPPTVTPDQQLIQK